MSKTNIRDFAEKYALPGFYLDIKNRYCIVVNNKLISAFNNSDTEDIDVCIDMLSSRGMFEQNIAWETPVTDSDVIHTINKFVLECVAKHI